MPLKTWSSRLHLPFHSFPIDHFISTDLVNVHPPQTELCPLLDSTLVAALLLEVDFQSSSQDEIASTLQTVYDALTSIAAHAEAEAAAEGLQDLGLVNAADRGVATVQNGAPSSTKTKSSSKGKRQRSGTATTNATTATVTTTTDTGTWPQTTSKSDSGSSKSGSSSPSNNTSENVDPHALAFLRTALPHLPTRTLINALAEWDEKELRGFGSASDVVEDGENGDIWTLISRLVKGEEEREMDERGVESDLGSDEAVPGEDNIDGLYLGGIGFHADGEKDHLAQLEADEKIARELALQFEAEDTRDPLLTVLARKEDRLDNDEWVIRSKKGKGKKGKATNKGHTRKDSTMKITLNDLWQQGQSVQQHHASDLSDPTPRVEDKIFPDLDLDVFLPSLSSYLTSLLPADRPPSMMFLQAGVPSSKASDKKTKTDIAAYIQNVFLNDRAVKAKFEGKVYRAVRSCLESVVQVAQEVKANAEQKRKAQELLAKEKEAAPKVSENLRSAGDLETQRGDGGSRHERRRGRGGRVGRGKRLPFEEPPHPPSRKMKNRVRTATDRDLASEREPGEGAGAREGAEGGDGEEQSEGAGRGDNEVEDRRKAEENAQQLLFTLLDILLPQYALVDSDDGAYMEVHQLLSDIELCITVLPERSAPGRGKDSGSVDGNEKERGENALDLATLLCELYMSDADPGREAGMFMDMLSSRDNYGGALGTRQALSYAETVGASRKTQLRGSVQSSGSAAGPSTLTKTTAVQDASVVLDEKQKNKPSPYQWQAVPSRRAPMKKAYTILPHLPTYKKDVNGIKARGDSDGGKQRTTWVPGSTSEYEEAEREHRRRVHENERRRKELLREAARMYNRSTQGPVAYYFAERAQECLDAARREQVNAARAMVLRKQAVSGDHDAIDLHGTTVAEAEAIVMEMLGKRRQGQFKIITGRGNHSIGGASVLKPALKKRLSEEGYAVKAWDAGLVVTVP